MHYSSGDDESINCYKQDNNITMHSLHRIGSYIIGFDVVNHLKQGKAVKGSCHCIGRRW